jgi:dihydroxyacetone kinase
MPPQIASALADEGAEAKAVYDIAEYVASRLGTIGAGLEHCHVRGVNVRWRYPTETSLSGSRNRQG